MVIDEKNNFVTARAFPELLTVQPTIRSSILTVKHAQMEPLHVNLAEVMNKQYTLNEKIPLNLTQSSEY